MTAMSLFKAFGPAGGGALWVPSQIINLSCICLSSICARKTIYSVFPIPSELHLINSNSIEETKTIKERVKKLLLWDISTGQIQSSPFHDCPKEQLKVINIIEILKWKNASPIFLPKHPVFLEKSTNKINVKLNKK